MCVTKSRRVVRYGVHVHTTAYTYMIVHYVLYMYYTCTRLYVWLVNMYLRVHVHVYVHTLVVILCCRLVYKSTLVSVKEAYATTKFWMQEAFICNHQFMCFSLCQQLSLLQICLRESMRKFPVRVPN